MAPTSTLEQERPEKAADRRLDLTRHIPVLCLTLGGKIALHAKRCSAKPLGLDLSEWRIIQVLGAAGRATIFDIADRISMDRGGTSRAIARLEDNGYLLREDDPTDRRRSFVDLTDAGWRLHDEIIRFSLAREERLLQTLSSKDRERFRDILKLLIDEADTMIAERWTPQAAHASDL